jgi:Phosphomannomutase
LGELDCFKAYDVRGEIGRTFNPEICYRISRAFAKVLGTKRVVIGHDARSTSIDFTECAIEGLIHEGVEVFELGLCGTEEVYWATTNFNACGGIQVTASHNPINYNGLKFVKSQSRPLNSMQELAVIKDLAEKEKFGDRKKSGIRRDFREEARESYIKKLLTFVDTALFRDYKVVVNSGNGAAGPTFECLKRKLSDLSCPLIFEHMFSEPDGNFPMEFQIYE